MADDSFDSCPSCGGRTRADARFCDECGAALIARCSGCGRELRAGAKFCDECGRPVGVGIPASDAVPAPPSDLTEKILASRESLEGERKHVTVLFADVKGSMDLQADLDAEEWANIMGRFLDILADGVHRFEGIVDKFTGDGIMALFGAPIAFEDHARRACHAALHLTEAIGHYAEELQRTHGLSFQMRQGLNSGEVVVGRIGDDAHMAYTAMGTTVGLAQRMETLAKPDKAYLTAATARLVTGFFRMKDLGEMPVKGMPDPVHAFALEGIGPLRSGLDVARQRGLSRFVGRDKEMAILESAFEQAMSGNAQVVGVVGEAGVGKSRICDEFARSCQARGVNVLRARGVSHGTSAPYLPVLELFRNYFGITDVDPPRHAREKIVGRLVLTDSSLEAELPVFFDLLEVPDPERPAPQLGEDARLRRVVAVIRRLARRRTERDEGLLVLLEDLHWLDGPSKQFFEGLVESYPGTRTLVLANFRPEFHAPWMRHSYYRQIPLAPLDREAVLEMISHVVGSDHSLVGFADHVIARAGGNPFFVEEVVRMLVDEGALEGTPGRYRLLRPPEQLSVPVTIKALLASRIDRLDPPDKHVLQTASVVGITFSDAVLARVTERSEDDLASSLQTLCASEFLLDEARQPVPEYRFWHPLTQEVAYGSMLSERRAHIHETVARALIQLEPERLNERAALIANHFEAAGETLEAARWNTRAADSALRTDMRESVRRWRNTIALLDGVPPSDEVTELGIRARHRLARYGTRMGMPQGEVDQILEDATELAQHSGNMTALANIMVARGTNKLFRGDVTAQAHYLEAVRLADTTPEVGLQTAVRVASPVIYGLTGPMELGFAMLDEALAMAEEDPDRGSEHLGYNLLARHLCSRSFLLARSGRLAEAAADADRAVAIARERSQSEILGWTIAVYPMISFYSGAPRNEISIAEEAVRVAEETGNIFLQPLVLCSLGIAHVNAESWEDAVRACELALSVAQERSVSLFEEGNLLTFLSLAYLGAGDYDAAARTAEDAVSVSVGRETPVFESGALVARSRIRRLSDPGHARQANAAELDRAVRLIDETGAEAWRPFVHLEYAELAGLERNDARRGREFGESLRLFEAMGATGHAARIREELRR
jgi:class 3 adenylate cyclase/tetratricopeptide (TPR) repeat protein